MNSCNFGTDPNLNNFNLVIIWRRLSLCNYSQKIRISHLSNMIIMLLKRAVIEDVNTAVGSVTVLCSFEGIVWGCYGNKSTLPLSEASGVLIKSFFAD